MDDNAGREPAQSEVDSSEPLVRVIDLTVRFGGVVAVSDVSVDFHSGQICGLIGPNGAGKTTLFDTISGIRPPTQGSIRYDGIDMRRKSVTWRSRHGMRRTFQRHQTFGWLSVEDNVLAALEWRGGGGGLLADMVRFPSRTRIESSRRRRVAEILELCSIADLAKVSAARLPLGKARLVEMARAIVDHPRVLLLDEPTSGLEESEVESFAESVRMIRKEEACTVVVIEHDVGFVMRLADRVVVLNLGTIVADGLPAEVRNNKTVAEAYFGSKTQS
jgi:ABC-type branched-subunit amino acid transport system ATPase component